MAVHMTSVSQHYLACKPIFKVHRRPWPTRFKCCGPLNLHALVHRLKTIGLATYTLFDHKMLDHMDQVLKCKFHKS